MSDARRGASVPSGSPLPHLYEAALAPARRPALLDHVASRCGAHGAWVFDVAHRDDFACRVTIASSAWDASAHVTGTWASEHARHEAPHLRRVARGRPGTIREEAAFADDSGDIGERPDVRFLRDRLDVFERCTLRLDDHPARPDCLALYYRTSRTGITVAERGTLAGLWPHVAQVVALGRAFDALRARFGAALTVLDHVGTGLALVSGDGHVVTANAAAHEIVERRAELGLGEDGRIGCRDPKIDARLRRTLLEVAGTVHGHGGPACVRIALGRAGAIRACSSSARSWTPPTSSVRAFAGCC